MERLISEKLIRNDRIRDWSIGGLWNLMPIKQEEQRRKAKQRMPILGDKK
jgi:hypothetical protein